MSTTRDNAMHRVVVTGAGIVSCLGNDRPTVTEALRNGRSGIGYRDAYAEMGLRSRVAGRPEIDLDARVPRKPRRFMGDAAAYAYVAMEDAAREAGLDPGGLSDPRIGLIAGSGGGSTAAIVEAADNLRSRGVKRVGAFSVPKSMSSTISACLATPFGIRGVNFSISSACATSAHCIGQAADLIRLGRQDIVFAGGGEEEHWSLSMLFDAMGALSASRNDEPARASRPYDAGRDGFVIARGAPILAELAGFGATSDGHDMVAPSGEGAVRCMQQAIASLDAPVDYINAHGTGTRAGDVTELQAIETVFGDAMPPVASTKSMTGHSLGGAGVQEAIYSLYMMAGGFIAPSINVETIDPEAADMPVVTQRREPARIDTVLSNSFGFGGTNASLVFRRWVA